MHVAHNFPILTASQRMRQTATESEMTYDASSEIIDLGTASQETKGPPGLPFPDALGAFAQQGLSND
jgi:hypothetical protein